MATAGRSHFILMGFNSQLGYICKVQEGQYDILTITLFTGKQRFGVYSFLPVFFCMGAALEFSMINWHAGKGGNVNFCE